MWRRPPSSKKRVNPCVGRASWHQVDRHGRLHWRGSLVKVSGRLTFWQSVGAVLLVLAAVVTAAATVVQAWAISQSDGKRPAARGSQAAFFYRRTALRLIP